MTDVKRGDAGVFTAEGAVAGARAVRLTQEREKQRSAYQAARDDIAGGNSRILPKNVNDKFAPSRRKAGDSVAVVRYGLNTLDEYRRAAAGELVDGVDGADGRNANASANGDAATGKKKRKMHKPSLLSFGGDDDDDDDDDDSSSSESDNDGSGSRDSSTSTSAKKDDITAKRKRGEDLRSSQPTSGAASVAASGRLIKKLKPVKNPDVDTSFLPDRARAERLALEKEKLRKEYLSLQAQLKAQLLEITYSWWDGSGHRRVIQVPQGTTILQFLDAVRQQLITQFPELRRVSADNLMYIKEDLIIPGDYTFYDLIKSKARGKSGPLFHFDVHDDIRLGPIDSRVEKDESHPGKVVERAWFERNKHIFPASRWEIYDPAKKWEKYTIHGGEVRSSKK
eukprot:g1024.t1